MNSDLKIYYNVCNENQYESRIKKWCRLISGFRAASGKFVFWVGCASQLLLLLLHARAVKEIGHVCTCNARETPNVNLLEGWL